MFRRSWCVLPFFFIGCNDSPPGPPPASSVQLAVEDASCTEAWLKVTLTDSNQPRTITLRRDGQTVLTAQLTANDSILIDEGLLPSRTYTYQAVRMRESVAVDASANAQLTTLDSTSHNWSFSVDTLGDASSVLYDVAIINDTLAYAVGEMYLRDSTGQIDPQAWNAAKWNGQRWELKRIPFIGPCSAVLYPPIKAIWAFAVDNILVTNGGSIVRYDGTSATMDCGMNSLLTGAINKIYGANPQDVYAVGNAGTIVHFNGSTWQRVESGTDVDIRDIWGGALNNRTEIIAIASYGSQVPQARKVLTIQGTTVSLVNDEGLPLAISAVWFMPFRKYYIGGAGVFTTYRTGTSWLEDTSQPLYYVSSIRGMGWNEIALSGGFGHLSYFNGVRWKHFAGSELPYIQGNLSKVAVEGSLLVSAGWLSNGKAIAVIGRR